MFRVRTVFQGIQGAPYVSTMYFSDVSLSPTACVTAVGLFWGTVDGSLPNTLTWSTEAGVATMNPTTGELTGLSNTPVQTGTGAIAAVLHGPAEQGLIRWRTGVFEGGREVRGRTFIPGMSNSTSTSGGRPTSTFITQVNTAGQALLDNSNVELVVWSRKNGSTNIASSAECWDQFAVLRSRRD